MCCILCEEPVRSVLVGLAAVGVVSIVRTVQKSVKRFASNVASTRERDARLEPTAPADNAL